jgi:hypothetical protein
MIFASPAIYLTAMADAAPSTPTWLGLALRLACRAALNPRLAADLLRVVWAFRRRNWWTRAPFLPLPDTAYVRWRMYTAYGEENAVPPLGDVVRFVRWRRETMHL